MSYGLLFHEGRIEQVDVRMWSYNGKTIACTAVEREVIKSAAEGVALLWALGVTEPIAFALTLTDVRGFQMGRGSALDWPDDTPIDREVVAGPVVLLEDPPGQ